MCLEISSNFDECYFTLFSIFYLLFKINNLVSLFAFFGSFLFVFLVLTWYIYHLPTLLTIVWRDVSFLLNFLIFLIFLTFVFLKIYDEYVFFFVDESLFLIVLIDFWIDHNFFTFFMEFDKNIICIFTFLTDIVFVWWILKVINDTSYVCI